MKPEFVDTTWDNIVAGLQAGKWDVSLAYHKENPKVPASAVSVADLDVEGVTMVVMSGTAQDKAISTAVKNATILRLPTADETRLALISKRADVLVDANDTNQLFLQANPDWAVALEPTPAPAKQGVAFGLPASLTAQDVEVVNIFLEERVATGHVEALIRASVDQVLAAGQ